jgi:hypothetical protein
MNFPHSHFEAQQSQLLMAPPLLKMVDSSLRLGPVL